MRGERYVLRAGEYLVSRACRRLPARTREERHQEWLAELPVILHDRRAGPAPLRVARMLAFALDTLRGTALKRAANAYQGTHRGESADNLRAVAIGLLLLIGGPLYLAGYEGYIVYQLVTGPSLVYSSTLALYSLAFFAANCIPRWSSAAGRWYGVSKMAVGAGLFVRAIASRSGWGHPLLFAIVSYCAYALSVACLGMAVVLLVRSIRLRPAEQ